MLVLEQEGAAFGAQFELAACERHSAKVDDEGETAVVGWVGTRTVIVPAQLVAFARNGLDDAAGDLAQGGRRR